MNSGIKIFLYTKKSDIKKINKTNKIKNNEKIANKKREKEKSK